ncbi:hypothetical protein [Pseudonocardia sp. ICBG601]|uniref:hypothetical protein n=1 Tax=Pseudonocardia sp. ICBG601 TaxID=2846759 RepID=UPI001CF6081D|nr:hypothetical protein [Pseudonocardia sp. ICBG601]
MAARAGGVRLVLGWVPGPAPDLDPDAFADIRTVVGGPGARVLIEAGHAHRVPARPLRGSGPARRSAAAGPAARHRRPRRRR